MDKLSLQRIDQLHPKLRENALQVYQEVCQALKGRAFCRITFGLRTFAEQQALYNQGRTTKGPVVTKAKPGSSFHNYGLAVDVVLIVDTNGDGSYDTAKWDTKGDYDGDKVADWMEVVAIFKKHGWKWGGDFQSFKDEPHFEKTFGYSWKQLLALHQAGKFIPGTKYVQI